MITEKQQQLSQWFLEGIYKEINTGSAYQEYVKNHPYPENTIILALIAVMLLINELFYFIILGDAVVVDGTECKPLELFSFMLAIFKKLTFITYSVVL